MNALPSRLYSAAQCRELDRLAIDTLGIPGGELMARAATAAFAVLRRRWPEARRLLVLCGAGNNGGDGYLLARLAHQVGLAVELWALNDPTALQGDAREAWQAAEAVGLAPRYLPTAEQFAALEAQARDADVVVDALLGTGLSGEVREPQRTLIERLNRFGRPTLAIDIPSGLDTDSGRVWGCALRADTTVTFIGLKPGLFTGEGPTFAGEVHFSDLQLPDALYDGFSPLARRLDWQPWPARRRDAHKGDFGHLLLLGGGPGMGGAIRLAGEAALRCGAGLVSVACHPDNVNQVACGRPELMVHAIDSTAELVARLKRASVVAIGPGLGLGRWGQGLLDRMLAWPGPKLFDADALNLLAFEAPAERLGDECVLTPHPGEAARLLGVSTAEVQADRPAAIEALRQRFGGTWLLKGAGTLILGPEGLALCNHGNPGMASGGMGDLLTGSIAALMAQGLTPQAAAEQGACLHAEAGDRAALEGERGLIASDLLPELRRLINRGAGNGA